MILVTGPSPLLLDVSSSLTSDTPPKLKKTTGLHTANRGESKGFLSNRSCVVSFWPPDNDAAAKARPISANQIALNGPYSQS